MGVKVIKGGGRRAGVAQALMGRSVRVVKHSTVVDSYSPRIHLENHPDTGACYIVVMPPHANVMMEHREGWKLNQRPWLRFIDNRSLQATFQQYRDRRALFCCWLTWELPWLPNDRRASFATLYAEALDDNIDMLMPQHRTWLSTFLKNKHIFDGVLGHTPWMAQKLHEISGLPSGVLPAGYDERILGTPQWDAPKKIDAAWYGTMVGKRERLVAKLRNLMGTKLGDLTGLVSRELVDRLQNAKTILYLGHSNIRSYSTWRTWHGMCSSAAIVTEPGDRWPLDDESCIEVPTIDESNIDEVARIITDLSPEQALSIARRAHERLRTFTVGNMIDNYLIPNTRAWLR